MPEGRKSIMDLSHRMVKNFWGMLSMSGKLDFPQLSELNNSGVRVSVRRSDEPGQPTGMIVSAASSTWLPLPSEVLLNFFTDEKTRPQATIPTVSNQHITVTKRRVDDENDSMTTTERYVDSDADATSTSTSDYSVNTLSFVV
ncbi:hypothetical protein U1Q18_039836 [Sarracenia purpurea var. burkii]